MVISLYPLYLTFKTPQYQQIMNSFELSVIGFPFIEDWLNNNGFSNISVTKIDNYTVEIQANGKLENILISVKTGMYPDPCPLFTNAEKFSLKEFAATLNKVPYLAYLSIDKEHKIAANIVWERLS